MSDPVGVTLLEQIAEVKREIAMRKRVYPRWVNAERMAKADAALRIAAMEAVLRTLEELNEPGLFSREAPPAVQPLRRGA